MTPANVEKAAHHINRVRDVTKALENPEECALGVHMHGQAPFVLQSTYWLDVAEARLILEAIVTYHTGALAALGVEAE